MSDLKTDYKDDVLDVSANVKRIFNLVDQDGKIVVANVSIQDITKYTQEGDSFGAADINATNEAVNGKLDGSSTVNPMLATEEGFAADAYQTKLQFDEQNKNIETLGESVSNGKTLVANAITAKGVSTSTSATFSTMATNIGEIKTTPTSFTSKPLESNKTISGLTVGATYILNIADLQNTTVTSIKSGANILKTVNAFSSDDYSGIKTEIITILFKATATSIVLQDGITYERIAYSLIKI